MKKIALVSVYSGDTLQYKMYVRLLYQLLAERTPEESISHKVMPSITEHDNFVTNHPYKSWYIIQSLEETNYPFVGAIYINYDNSIGISIFNTYKRQHYATAAIKALMDLHYEKYYFANINPNNLKSKELFKRLGFKYNSYTLEIPGEPLGKSKIIQETYIFTRDDV